MYTRKKVEVQCSYCNTKILKDESEVKRNLSLKRENFCNRICLGKSEKNVKRLISISPKTGEHLNPANRKDEFTEFRVHLRRIKKRSKEVNITLEDLKEIWEQQNGKCVYSGVTLIKSSNKTANSHLYTMSLDRIDSSKGYVKGNVQFISIAMNHLKNSMTHDQMLEILRIIRADGVTRSMAQST